MIRWMLERLARGRVVRRRLPRAFGRRAIYISPDAALGYLKPGWDKSSRLLFTSVQKTVCPGDTVWDVGGNCGVFSLAAAHAAGPSGKTLVLEPDPFLAWVLQRTFGDRGNADLDAHVLCVAAADRPGIDRFLIAARGRASSALEQCGQRSQAGGVRAVEYVPVVTLDSLLDVFPPPHVLKIDVEGAEALVLRGAAQLLERFRPILHIEVGEAALEEVTSVLHRYQYRLYDADSDCTQALSSCAFNTAAIPPSDFSRMRR